MLTRPLLETYAGQTMRDICPNGYHAARDNHCAHFVAHVLQLDFGMTCARMTGSHSVAGANLRVHELYSQCPTTTELLECPLNGEGILFVSERSNFRGGALANVRKKHVGLMINGLVWHYSNTRHRVESETAGEFLFHYRRQTNALWWGTFPTAARPTTFATSS